MAFCDIDKTRRGRGYHPILTFVSCPNYICHSFIEYFSQEDADHAIKVLNSRELCGNIVNVAAYVSCNQIFCPFHIDALPRIERTLFGARLSSTIQIQITFASSSPRSTFRIFFPAKTAQRSQATRKAPGIR